MPKKKSTTEPAISESLDFESALKQLESIVGALEHGHLPLEAALEQFKQGVGLSDFCQKKLDNAQLVVKELSDRLETDADPADESPI